MDSYFVYVVLAIITISIPGPGVILTINNAMYRGFSKSFVGAVGISFGILLVAIISATGLGILLSSSATAFTMLKYAGALYLVYMGIKMWRSKSEIKIGTGASGISSLKCFYEGVLLSLSNPKSIVFFMSIFPQFIDPSISYAPQFVLLALTFSALILVIHTLYATVSVLVKARIQLHADSLALNKIGGGMLVSFGIGLAASNRQA